MALAKPTKYVPVFSHTGGNYPAGSDPWSNTARNVEPTIAKQAAGATPKTGLGAQHYNYLLNALGNNLDSIMDLPSYQWEIFPAFTNSDFSTDATGNRNQPSHPRFIYSAGERWLQKTEGGPTGVAFWWKKDGQGLTIDQDSDTQIFTTSTNSGATALATLITRPDSNIIVAVNPSDGVARQSSDFGATWAAAGDAGEGAYLSGGFYGGKYVVAKFNGPNTWRVSSTSDLVTWTETDRTVSVNGGGGELRRYIRGGPVGIFLQEVTLSGADARLLINTTGDGASANWTSQAVPFSAKNGWRGDYNQSLGLYLLTNLEGECWVSSNGTAWTNVHTDAAESYYDVAAHGRGFVLSAGKEDFSGTAVPAYLKYGFFDYTGVFNVSRIPLESPGTNYSRFHLQRHRGRVIAARMVIPSGQVERIEYWYSNVHPIDVVSTTGLGV